MPYDQLCILLGSIHMKKLIAALLVCSLLFVSAVGAMAAAIVPADADLSFEIGSRVQINQLTIVNLHGSWYEMGRQYGYLVSQELANVAALCDEIISADEANATKAENTLRTQHIQMPYTIRQFFQGILYHS